MNADMIDSLFVIVTLVALWSTFFALVGSARKQAPARGRRCHCGLGRLPHTPFGPGPALIDGVLHQTQACTPAWNQCDGCLAGRPLVRGRHAMGDGAYANLQACERPLYEDQNPEARR